MSGLMIWFSLICQLIVAEDNVNLKWGNPSNAGKDSHNYLVEKHQYCLSYNASLGQPNWVSWNLNSKWLGDEDRQNDFHRDESLPFNSITSVMYSKTGFDKGHLCPSGDRTKTVIDNQTTFLMSNMVPQAPHLNRGPWKLLEEHCRSHLKGRDLWIIAGPHGTGGSGSLGHKGKISGKINVPSSCWKVVMIVDNGKEPDAETTAYGVIMPNTQRLGDHWEEYKVTVRSVEELTGYNFFSELPKIVQDAMEEND